MTRLEVDLDIVEKTAEGTRSQRMLAILIGVIALLAALLALLQTNASLEGTRASLVTTRMGAAISERIATSQSYNDFILDRQRAAIIVGIRSTSRLIAALEQGDPQGIHEAMGTAEASASERLLEIVPRMASVPSDGGPLDAHTADVIQTSLPSLTAMVTERERQRALGEVWGGRSSRAVLGLTILALSGVLAGLTAILGEGRPGRIALGTAAATTAVAAFVGLSAVV